MPIIVAWTLRKANNCNVQRIWMSWLRMTCMYNKRSTWYSYNNMSNYIFFLQFPLMFCRIFCFLYCFWYHILINQNRRYVLLLIHITYGLFMLHLDRYDSILWSKSLDMTCSWYRNISRFFIITVRWRFSLVN